MPAPVGEAGGGADPPARLAVPVSAPGRPPRLLIYAITVTGILNNTVLVPSLPDIVDDFGAGSSAAGLIVAAGSFPGIVVAPLIGLLADRYGRRVVLVPCLVAYGLFGLGSAVAPSLEVMVGARLLQALGTAGLINLAVVLISDHWSGPERTKLIGRNAAVLTLALAVTPALGGFAADVLGWRAALALYATGLPVAVLVWRTLPPDRPAATETVAEQVRAARAAVANPVVTSVLGSGVLVFVLIFGGFLTAFPVHLEEVFSLGPSERGLLIAVPAAASCVVAFNLGRIRARWSLRGLLIAAGAAYVLAFAGVAAAGTVAVIVLASTLHGLAEGIFIPSLQDAVAEEAPPERRGAVFAVWVGAARLGQTVGPLLAGAALALTTTAGTFVLGALLAVLLLVVQVRGPVGRTPEPAPAPAAPHR